MISFYSITSKLKTAIMLMLFIVYAGNVFAQDQLVRGVVSDSQTREPIVGATVIVDGTGTVDITDANGAFSLNASRGASLSISFFGYESRQVTVTASTLNVALNPQSFEVEEVVVVGTVMRKSDLTGAVAGVSAKVLAEKPVTSVNQALQGRLAGVFITQGAKPTDDASIRVRGINTIDGSTDPIYVVDGIIMDNWYGGFSATNVSDIASVEVLKDASATALYGSRGSNGVVVITTKKGRSGEGTVSYDGWVGVQTFGYQPKLMNPQQLADARRQAYTNGFIQNYMNQNQVAPSQADIDAYVRSELDTPGRIFTQTEKDALKDGKNYNWLDKITRNAGIQHNHALSFSGGSEKGSFYLSFGYMDNQGLIKKTEQTRYTGRINSEYAVKKWLKVGTNTSFTSTFNSKVDDNVFSRARSSSPFREPNDTQMYTGWNDADNNAFNPLRTLWIDDHERLNRLMSSNFINIEPIKGLNIRSTLAMDHATAVRNYYVPNNIGQAERDSHGGRARDNRDSRMMWQWDNSISYNTVLNDRHRISAMVGTSTMSTKTNWINTQAEGFFTNDFTYHNMNANMRKDTFLLSSDWNEQALMSYIARASYSFDDRYLITATVRADGSSKFAKGNQWGTFPSVSVAWNIAQERFMERQNIFNQLKLRAGFGAVGNQNIPDFMPLTLYTVGGGKDNDGNYVPSSVLDDGRRGTPGITWERQQQWNLGLDMAFLHNRITFTIDAYLIDNKDLLMSRSLPGISGYQKATENIGVIRNKGIEFALNAAIVDTKDFKWNLSGTFSLDRNKVTKLWGGRTFIHNINDQNIQNEGNLFVGHSRNNFYMMPSAGIAQESDMWYINTLDLGGFQVFPGDLFARDVNGDGRINATGDRIVVGSKDPKFYGGFATDFSWKGLTLNAVFTYSYGAKRLGGWYNDITSAYGRGMTSADLVNNTWTPENTGAEFPRLMADNGGYSRWGQGSLDSALQDASYLRLSTLTLSYTFPSRITNAIRMSNLRVYATGSNLFCITPYKGYDPEFGDSYPATRMWTFGLNVSF